MTTRGALAYSDPPLLQPVRTGLLRSAQPIPEGIRWEVGGLSYRPNNATVPAVTGSTQDPCGDDTLTRDQTGPVSWNSWWVGLGDECLSGATDDGEEARRSQHRVEVQTSYMLERTFWTGEVGISDFGTLSWPNRPLADLAADDLTATGPVGVVTAIARAVDYLADTIGDVRGMIHVPVILLPFLAFYGVVRREGVSLVTALADHVVIAGTGYPGTTQNGEPPAAGTTWIYVTSMVRADASPVMAVDHLNRENNYVQANAGRKVIAEWDLQAHAAIEVCIPDPGPSCVEVPS